jgi:hypothetical protein
VEVRRQSLSVIDCNPFDCHAAVHPSQLRCPANSFAAWSHCASQRWIADGFFFQPIENLVIPGESMILGSFIGNWEVLGLGGGNACKIQSLLFDDFSQL